MSEAKYYYVVQYPEDDYILKSKEEVIQQALHNERQYAANHPDMRVFLVEAIAEIDMTKAAQEPTLPDLPKI